MLAGLGLAAGFLLLWVASSCSEVIAGLFVIFAIPTLLIGWMKAVASTERHVTAAARLACTATSLKRDNNPHLTSSPEMTRPCA